MIKSVLQNKTVLLNYLTPMKFVEKNISKIFMLPKNASSLTPLQE